MFRDLEVLSSEPRAVARKRGDELKQSRHTSSEMNELARVLCVAMVEPSFRNALLDNPEQAVQNNPHHHFKLSQDEQDLLKQPGLYSLRTLAETIERSRRL